MKGLILLVMIPCRSCRLVHFLVSSTGHHPDHLGYEGSFMKWESAILVRGSLGSPSYPFFFKLMYFLFLFFIVQLQLSPFSPITLPCPTHAPSHLILPPVPIVFVHRSLICITFPLLSPVISPLPSGHCQFCSLFQCLWFYFAHLFVLLIRFHL